MSGEKKKKRGVDVKPVYKWSLVFLIIFLSLSPSSYFVESSSFGREIQFCTLKEGREEREREPEVGAKFPFNHHK